MLTTLAGGTIFAERFGAPPFDVIALHGWGRTGADFDPLLRHYQALAVHLPGFGPAPAPETGWSTADYATWLAAGIDPNHPAVIVGHSFGGRVALRLAEAFPHLVRALVLTGVPLRPRTDSPRRPPLSLRLVKALRRRGVVSEKPVEGVRRKYGSADYLAATGVMREVLVRAVNEDYTEALASLTMPVYLVWGEGDVPAPLERAREAIIRTPRHHLTVVPGSAHLLDQGLVDALRQTIDGILASEASAGEK